MVVNISIRARNVDMVRLNNMLYILLSLIRMVNGQKDFHDCLWEFQSLYLEYL